MATPLDYAQLSRNVYEDAGQPAGWTRIDTRRINSTDFDAATYRHDTTGEIVVAYRGTGLTDLGDALSDFQIGLGQVPVQYANALRYYNDIRAAFGASAKSH